MSEKCIFHRHWRDSNFNTAERDAKVGEENCCCNNESKPSVWNCVKT